MHVRFPGGPCPRLQCDIAWCKSAAPNMGRSVQRAVAARLAAREVFGFPVGTL